MGKLTATALKKTITENVPSDVKDKDVLPKVSYGKIPQVMDVPFLIGIQLDSYKWFMEEGLKELFERIFPVKGYSDNLELEFEEYFIGAPTVSVDECKNRDLTYSAPLRLRLRLHNKLNNTMVEQDVFLGDIPLMTETGTFVINGAERAVVSQLVRSPGVYYMEKLTPKEAISYYGRIIPNRGAWVEVEYERNGVSIARLDKVKKISLTNLLLALGFTIDTEKWVIKHEPIEISVEPRSSDLNGLVPPADIKDPKTKKLLAQKGVKITREVAEKIADIIDSSEHITFTYKIKDLAMNESLIKTYEDARDAGIESEKDALIDIYKKLRPGDPPNLETARNLIESRFFDEKKYDLSPVGRYKLNKRLGIDVPESIRYLTKIDLIETIRNLYEIDQDSIDDIDHLGNRRIRSVGELIQNHFRKGLLRMERVAKERMATQDATKLTPQALINTRSVVAVLKEFFGSSQLSQFMDQTNPLAELTHKRRLSALGPGGLSRERAGFEVRDVHHSHYGRICPIESPEGPNIGLIGSLASYAKINKYGFIETPYRVVEKSKVTDKLKYLTADEEDKYKIAGGNQVLDKNNKFTEPRVSVHFKKEVLKVDAEEVQLMDISPMQIVSPTTALIPFLEHDDANRALMGSNMQRQAVPLMTTEAPLVSTGMESRIAHDSGVVIKAKRGGRVVEVQSDKIVIEVDKKTQDVYPLQKFLRSNQGTCMNQRSIVDLHDEIKEGDPIADGFSVDKGELALGKNIMVAFMPWRGYNYEDAILISSRLVEDDVYTSIHIDKWECEARDTKLGPEEITRDIPHLGEHLLRNLDEHGVIVVSTSVKSEDILVGKVTPKGETEPTPEEKLLRAIFGEKSLDVRNTSLKVPHGGKGKVIDVRTFSREAGDELSPGVNKLVRVLVAQRRKIQEGDKMAGRHGNKGVVSKIIPKEDMPFLEDGTPIDIILSPMGVPSRMNLGQILETHLGWAAHKLAFRAITPVFDSASEVEISEALKAAGYPEDGKVKLCDGKTGEPFDTDITVGYIYMMKLNHLVEDKIHARSVGSYALVTQQPLGGKAQFGGQRFGEMEVWALEAYGAAYTLQEVLTIKSDDVEGRNRTYEAIVKGDILEDPGIPESFNVLIKELQGLCLDFTMSSRREADKEDEEDSMFFSASAAESEE